VHPTDPRIGTTLKGKWSVDRVLGVGGMATVYAATHRNGKRVAIKMLHPELSRDTTVRQRFVREGYLANKVGKGAVTVDDDDVTDDGAAFIVMEMLEGETLEGRRERSLNGRLPAREVASLMDQVLDTLASAHALGVVHRDLKPENMFLTTEGVVKILDFGIARLREGSGQSKSATATGNLMGTPAYLPPEQARGRWNEVDARSDIWAVGATMFVLLTGRTVHDAETVPELLLQAMTQPAPTIRSIAPFVPEELAEVVDRALLRERDARWPDATVMRGALQDALAEGLSAVDRGAYGGARAPSFSAAAHVNTAPAASAPASAGYRAPGGSASAGPASAGYRPSASYAASALRAFDTGESPSSDSARTELLQAPNSTITTVQARPSAPDTARTVVMDERAAARISAPGAPASAAMHAVAGTLSSRTLSVSETQSGGSKGVAIALAGVALLGGVGATVWFVSSKSPTPAPGTTATTEAVAVTGNATNATALPAVTAAPRVVPTPTSEPAAKPVSVMDLPDVSPAASASGAPAKPRLPTTAIPAAPIPAKPIADPTAKPAAAAPAKPPADPFTSRR
jgi:serine/threonine-protein kinase